MASGWRRLSSRYWRRIGDRPTSSMPGNVSVPSSTRFFIELWPGADGGRRSAELGNRWGRVRDLIEGHMGSPEHQRTHDGHRHEQGHMNGEIIGGRLKGWDTNFGRLQHGDHCRIES